ncbi:FAD-dependent oxidoreductase [Tsukamurella ocularis]|uniref:FAD-dependent oxidoreductase n=1 Tax=Tsukamurella ocularis TaxID=1970234 RepID=UPI002167530D|nr:FAD-dependent oxidoreductase [Tsukamurella ocularis]MCS3780736.1 2-polyprenyl-6-methoxyphenol hydroxylase-like FAD-dependent oxidoreductase [Tsukamurella ocularis]MCS3786560.1 2-polyprenyl-6-methoxyphenol hydroxylase-like FAD-dependent oxidoreductase [Tsukamurella ocularis]MCS3850402.1 2-polyprenyl-6-methoxyphenol hydroxylase-like FAD-dependent oxidoreductase [Tsukamurella ocularis]
MPDHTERPLRIVIAGAGIAGLATALRLHRDGHSVLVVERAPARRTGGYLVNLLGAGFDAAENLGLVPALRERDQGVFTSLLVRADGSTKLTMPASLAEKSLGSRALTVFRGDLEATLHDALDDAVEIRFATTVTAADDADADDADGPLRVRLSDGTVHDADVLVGADGLHSGIRDLAFGPSTEFVRDLQHAVAAFPLAVAPEGLPEQTASTYIDVGRTAAVFHPRGHAPSAFFTYRTAIAEADAADSPASALAAHFGDLTGPMHDVIQGAASTQGAYFDSVSQVVMDAWSGGRVVLLGDAAWCVSLFAGHGAGLALAGADRLGRALVEHPGDMGTALKAWEAGLRPEVTKHQRRARAGMARFAPPSRLHLGVQDLTIRALTAPLVGPALLRLMSRAR